MGKFEGLKRTMAIGMAKELARRAFKDPKIKQQFYDQLDEIWFAVLANRKGAIEFDKEVSDMKKRLDGTGFREVFKSAGITDDDLIASLRKCIEKAGKHEKQETK